METNRGLFLSFKTTMISQKFPSKVEQPNWHADQVRETTAASHNGDRVTGEALQCMRVVPVGGWCQKSTAAASLTGPPSSILPGWWMSRLRTWHSSYKSYINTHTHTHRAIWAFQALMSSVHRNGGSLMPASEGSSRTSKHKLPITG